MKRVEVLGVRVEMPSNQPIVLLREVEGERYLPIWIGAHEATAIAYVQQGVEPPRPLTHDLLKDVLDAVGRPLIGVRVTRLEDGVFFAELDLGDGVVVSARPSDAIALALRTASPIDVAEAVLAEAGVMIPEEGEDEEVEMEKFREFLDQVTPEDFGSDS
ncbi:MAG: bifunctional nuclease family protein [Candidatus Nanopelagicales bacterium]